MLDKLISDSPLLNVTEYSRTYITGDTNNSLTGQVRFNIHNQKLEVYTGHTWMSITWDHSIGLGADVQKTVEWVRRKMEEEQELQAKLEKYPGLKTAHEQFKMLEALAYEEDKLGA